MPKGSAAAANAAKGAEWLDEKADQVAQFEIMNDLANGEVLTTDNGKTSIYAKDTRKERLFPTVYAAFEAKQAKEFGQGFRAAREQNLLLVDIAMMEYAARNNPQGFYDFLAQAVIDKKLTAGDFTRLRDKFNNNWMKGFSGEAGQMTKQSAMAADMLEKLKQKLGVDFTAAVKTNDFGSPVNKNGMLDWDEKVELPDASVGREFQKIVRRGDLFMGQGTRTATRKETIEGEMLKRALDEAMTLWSLNGLEIRYDPVTGEKLPEGKTHEVDALSDFDALLDRLADEKNVLTAADELKRQSSGYMATVRHFGEAEMRRRTERMTGSKPVTDKQAETEEK